MTEIAEHCQGVKVVLVALKCDLREETEKEEDGPEDGPGEQPRDIIQYQEGLDAARRIGALRYLGKSCLELPTTFMYLQSLKVRSSECSAMRNRGVNEAFTEAARVALQVKPAKSKAGSSSQCVMM